MSELSLGFAQRVGDEVARDSERYFFDVSVVKLLVMSIATLNLYQLYWFYKNWQMAKHRGEPVNPLVRTILGAWFAYALFKEINEVGVRRSVSPAFGAGVLTLLYILLVASSRLPDPLWLISFASVIPIAFAQAHAIRVDKANHYDTENRRFTALNIVGIVIGVTFLLLLGIGLAES